MILLLFPSHIDDAGVELLVLRRVLLPAWLNLNLLQPGDVSGVCSAGGQNAARGHLGMPRLFRGLIICMLLSVILLFVVALCFLCTSVSLQRHGC